MLYDLATNSSTPGEEFLLSQLKCEKVTEGLRDFEAVAAFLDYKERRHFIRVERDFLSEHDSVWFLPIGIVHVDPKSRFVLIELPHEAETGANRLWVKPEQLDEIEAMA